MKRNLTLSFLLFLLFTFSPSKVLAQVVINEFSPLSSPDWVEVYNNSTESANLTEYELKDKVGNVLSLSGTINSSGFAVFSWSNRLDNAGDIFQLIKLPSEVVMTVAYGDEGGVCLPRSATGSIAWIPDGGNTYDRLLANTMGITNGTYFTDPCPTPTPAPTNTPTQTPIPTPSPMPTKTSTPTPTKTPTPIPTFTKTPTPKPTLVIPSSTESSQEAELVLGIRNESSSPSSDATSEDDVVKKKFPIIPVILIFTGVLCVGAGIFFTIKNNVKKANEEEDNKIL